MNTKFQEDKMTGRVDIPPKFMRKSNKNTTLIEIPFTGPVLQFFYTLGDLFLSANRLCILKPFLVKTHTKKNDFCSGRTI